MNLAKTFLLTTLFSLPLFSQSYDIRFISDGEEGLEKLVELQPEIKDIHPLLETFQPVAIVDDDMYYIFDYDSYSGKYMFQKKEQTSFSVPPGIRASFPLSAYYGRPTCVVTMDVFDFEDGYVSIFHEFVHCFLFNTVETEIKQQLEVYQTETANNNYQWEDNFNFPYDSLKFSANYDSLITALDSGWTDKVTLFRKALKDTLSNTEYEYMCWQEWKEGFGREIENKIFTRLGYPENDFGNEKPYNRLSFHYTGEKIIELIIAAKPELYTDLKALFSAILNFY